MSEFSPSQSGVKERMENVNETTSFAVSTGKCSLCQADRREGIGMFCLSGRGFA